MTYKGSPSMIALYEKARAAGLKAGQDVVPVPMHVVQRANPLDDTSPITKRYEPVLDGVCGFAWIRIKPARGLFVSFCKENDIGRPDSYQGGYIISVHDFNQSLTRKEAYAHAFARVLSAAGLTAYGESRID